MDGQGTKRRRNIAENFNRRITAQWAHERYIRQTDRRQRDGRRHIANVIVSSRSLKMIAPFSPLNNTKRSDKGPAE